MFCTIYLICTIFQNNGKENVILLFITREILFYFNPFLFYLDHYLNSNSHHRSWLLFMWHACGFLCSQNPLFKKESGSTIELKTFIVYYTIPHHMRALFCLLGTNSVCNSSFFWGAGGVREKCSGLYFWYDSITILNSQLVIDGSILSLIQFRHCNPSSAV